MHKMYKALKDDTNRLIEKRIKQLKSMTEDGEPIDFVSKMMEIQGYENSVLEKCQQKIQPTADLAESNQSTINELLITIQQMKKDHTQEINSLKETIQDLLPERSTAKESRWNHNHRS